MYNVVIIPTQNHSDQNQQTSTWIHRRISAVLSFGVFTLWNLPTLRVRITNMKASRRAIPNTPPNSPLDFVLSSIPSDEEADSDLLANQTLAPPKEGNHISSTEWTPIATSNTSRTRTRKKTKASSKVEPVRFPEWTPETSTYLSKKPKPKRKPSTRKNEGYYRSF
ncbi:hypothetical protein PGTUg99_000298 [Puccinia graminis f. sp. tritici]|uniref:Uncharacterized protein n=1 Tax=Puccinia graminis f. sp. tritici TaxID=56615 RepID=A0A5B0S2Z3_PUCGR|nr:hypothetical protein PGTUg99_000298 [Puccinia graminis f. sp. tritici]